MDRNETSKPWDGPTAGSLPIKPCRLPVSGIEVHLRQFAGREDLLLAEASALGMSLAMAILESVASCPDEFDLDWPALPATDIDTALLHIRRSLFGDLISADVTCPAQGCGKRIDVRFSIAEFLTYRKPRRARGVEAAEPDQPGWYRLSGTSVMFRPPTGGDIVAAAAENKAEQGLVHRCVRPGGLRAPVLRRVMRALEVMAPSLADELQGECAECGAVVDIYFDARSFTLRELRDQATFVYGDIHMLAHYYHWAEADILALSRDRRIRYVEMLQQQRGTV